MDRGRGHKNRTGVVIFVTDPSIKSTSAFGSDELKCGTVVFTSVICAVNMPFAKISCAISTVFECMSDGGHILRQWIIMCGYELMGITTGEE